MMAARPAIPIIAPDVGASAGAVEVIQWLVDDVRQVSAGDRIVELLADGVVFHLATDRSGRIERIERDRGALAAPGETLAWLSPGDDE